MKQFDSLTTFKTDSGVLIEEKNKGFLKMLLVILRLGVIMLLGGFILDFFAENIGLTMAPFMIWFSALIISIAVITNPKLIFDTTKNQLCLRIKTHSFTNIEQIFHQEQAMMGKK